MTNEQAKKQLERAREQIDEIDRVIVAALEERMQSARSVAEAKKTLNMPIFVPEREKAVIASRCEALDDASFAPYVERLFELIMRMSKEEQQKTQ